MCFDLTLSWAHSFFLAFGSFSAFNNIYRWNAKKIYISNQKILVHINVMGGSFLFLFLFGHILHSSSQSSASTHPSIWLKFMGFVDLVLSFGYVCTAVYTIWCRCHCHCHWARLHIKNVPNFLSLRKNINCVCVCVYSSASTVWLACVFVCAEPMYACKWHIYIYNTHIKHIERIVWR